MRIHYELEKMTKQTKGNTAVSSGLRLSLLGGEGSLRTLQGHCTGVESGGSQESLSSRVRKNFLLKKSLVLLEVPLTHTAVSNP